MVNDIEAQRVALTRARVAYERSRRRHAALRACPLLALSIAAAVLCSSTKPLASCGLGLVLVVTGWFFLWRGQALGRAVFPGVAAGLIPLALAIGARLYGHVCTGTGCVSLCVPACTIGGILAGVAVVYASRSRHGTFARVPFLWGASALAATVGAFGCSCVGWGGLAGLGAGLAVTLVPASLSMLRAP